MTDSLRERRDGQERLPAEPNDVSRDEPTASGEHVTKTSSESDVATPIEQHAQSLSADPTESTTNPSGSYGSGHRRPDTEENEVGMHRESPWDILVDVIVAPVKAFQYLSVQRHVGLAYVVAFVVVLLGMLAADPVAVGDQALLDDARDGGLAFWPVWLGSAALGAAIGLVLAAGFQHIVVWLLGGKNRFSYTFQAMGFAVLPNVFLAPLAVVHRMVDLGAFMLLANRGVYIWSLVLLVIAMREVHKFSTGRAIAAVAIPLVIGAVLTFVVAFLALGALLI